LRPLGGHPQSPPKRTTASPPRSANRGNGVEEVGREERGGQQRWGKSPAVVGVNTENKWKNGSDGGSKISGITPDTQQNLFVILDENMLHKKVQYQIPRITLLVFQIQISTLITCLLLLIMCNPVVGCLQQ